MIVTHDYSVLYRKLKEIPEERRYEMVLGRNIISYQLSRGVFYKPIIIIYIYKENDIVKLLKLPLDSLENEIVIVVPINYLTFFQDTIYTTVTNLEVVKTSITEDEMLYYVQSRFLTSVTKAQRIIKTYEANINLMNQNEEVILNYVKGKTSKLSVVYRLVNYNHVLLYIVGDKKIDDNLYLSLLYKYRKSKNHIILYLIKEIDKIYKFYIGESEPKDRDRLFYLKLLKEECAIEKLLMFQIEIKGKNLPFLLTYLRGVL